MARATGEITVTITGTNDGATVGDASVDLDETDVALTTSGSISAISDADDGEAKVQPFTDAAGDNGHGTFTVDADGNWGFTANSAFDELNDGDVITDTITVTSADGTATGEITVTITGTNDGATVGDASVDLDETDVALTTSGSISISDADDGEAKVQPFTDAAGDNGHGTFTVDADGNWGFTANSAFDELNDGDVITDTITVTSADGTATGEITVTITGTNDGATVGDASVDLDETDVALTTSGSISISDADDGEAKVQPFTDAAGDNGHGTFTVDADGNWGFTANSAFDELNDGDVITDTITVTSADGTATGEITVTITGTNDGATVGDASVDLDETDVALTTSGSISISDADDGEAKVQPFTDAAGDNGHGTFTVQRCVCC